MNKTKALFLLLAGPLLFSSAEVSFRSPDINARNEVLFTVRTDVSGERSYDTLFLRSIDGGSTEQLTCFPEAIESLSGGRVMQVRNRFGTGRYDLSSAAFSWITETRPFVSGGSVLPGALPDVATSPDGRWIVSVEPASPARGKLVLFDASRGVRYVLAASVERGSVPATWSPDSSVIVYAVGGTLYFARPESFFSVSAVGEAFRVLGPGSVSCVAWYGPSRFLYAAGANVYSVQVSELFARSLYGPLLGVGALAGKLPFSFDPSADSFSASPDGNSILVSRKSRAAYFIPLAGDDYATVARPAELPWLLLPGNTASVSASWSAGNDPVVYARSVTDGAMSVRAWRLVASDAGKTFVSAPVPPSARSFAVSRDGSFVAFILPDSVKVYNVSSWSEVSEYRDERPVTVAWADGSRLFVGGEETVRRWDIGTGSLELLLVSSVSASGWDENEAAVVADTSKNGRIAYSGKMKWAQSSSSRIRPPSSANSSWRLYVDTGLGTYSNMLYVRSAANPAGTKPIVPEKAGTRGSPKRIALVFDAVDGVDGLPRVLHSLSRRGIRATFFFNGEFVRRNPAACVEIVKAGHQAASMFFTTWDLAGPSYRIDEDFVMRGLARNEDDFYNATGQELSLLWHAPHYVSSPLIERAGARAGYRYVTPGVIPADWATVEQDSLLPGTYKGAAAIVEDIVASLKPGAVVPVRIGAAPGTREDYLFDKIDILLNAIIEEGYSIVTVDGLSAPSR